MIKQPTPYTCYPTALSILTGVPVKELIKPTGHTGDEFIRYNKQELVSNGAFIHPEMAMVLLHHGWAIIPIWLGVPSRPWFPDFKDILITYNDEKLILVAQKPKVQHCYAYDGTCCFDPMTGGRTELPIPYPLTWVEIVRRIERPFPEIPAFKSYDEQTGRYLHDS